MDILTATKKARSFLYKHRWGQGSYYRNGAYCAIGAVRAVVRNEYGDINASLKDTIESNLSNCVGQEITEYNDTKGRKKKEVLAAFDCAIEKLERENASSS